MAEQQEQLVAQAPPAELHKGVVKWFNVVKGWGFISPEDGSAEVFVHQSVIQMPGFRSLGEGELVEFASHQGDRGLEATFVQGPNGAPCRGSLRQLIQRSRPRKKKCYNCQMVGHFAKDCDKEVQPKRCHSCGSPDHLVAECPARSERPPPPSSST